MRSFWLMLPVVVLLAACSQHRVVQTGLPKPIDQYTDAEAKALLAQDCTPYAQKGDEADAPLTAQACALLSNKIDVDSLKAEAAVKTKPVPFPVLQ